MTHPSMGRELPIPLPELTSDWPGLRALGALTCGVNDRRQLSQIINIPLENIAKVLDDAVNHYASCTTHGAVARAIENGDMKVQRTEEVGNLRSEQYSLVRFMRKDFPQMKIRRSMRVSRKKFDLAISFRQLYAQLDCPPTPEAAIRRAGEWGLLGRLTLHELHVLVDHSFGLEQKESADKRYIGVNTHRLHARELMRTLGAAGIEEAVDIGVREGDLYVAHLEPAPSLSDEQKQIIRGLANALTNAAIGTSIGLDEAAVKRRLKIIYPILGAKNRAHAVRKAHAYGILPG